MGTSPSLPPLASPTSSPAPGTSLTPCLEMAPSRAPVWVGMDGTQGRGIELGRAEVPNGDATTFPWWRGWWIWGLHPTLVPSACAGRSPQISPLRPGPEHPWCWGAAGCKVLAGQGCFPITKHGVSLAKRYGQEEEEDGEAGCCRDDVKGDEMRTMRDS